MSISQTQAFHADFDYILYKLPSRLCVCVCVCEQGEKSSLQQIAQRFQAQLDQTKAQLHQTRSQCKKNRTHLDQTRIQLEQFTTNLLDPQEVQGGLGELDEDKCRY